jgi:hypothetical protein
MQQAYGRREVRAKIDRKLYWKRQHGRARHKWENNIKMDAA